MGVTLGTYRVAHGRDVWPYVPTCVHANAYVAATLGRFVWGVSLGRIVLRTVGTYGHTSLRVLRAFTHRVWPFRTHPHDSSHEYYRDVDVDVEIPFRSMLSMTMVSFRKC